eukprot:313113-Hanusia_phi.AAC.1
MQGGASPFGNTGASGVSSNAIAVTSSSSGFGNTGASGIDASAGPTMSSRDWPAPPPWHGFGSPDSVVQKPQKSTAIINRPVYDSPAVINDDHEMQELINQVSQLSVKHNDKEVQAIIDDVVEIHGRLRNDMNSSIQYANSLKSFLEAGIAEKQNQMVMMENLLGKVGQLLGYDIATDVKHKKSRLTAAAGGGNESSASGPTDDANLEFLLFQKNVTTKQYISNWFIGPSSVAERRFFLKFLYNRLKNGYHGPFSKEMLLETIQNKALFYTVAKHFLQDQKNVTPLNTLQKKRAWKDINACLRAEEEPEGAREVVSESSSFDSDQDEKDPSWKPSSGKKSSGKKSQQKLIEAD